MTALIALSGVFEVSHQGGALTYLVTALSSLNVHNFTHLDREGWFKAHKQEAAKEKWLDSAAFPAKFKAWLMAQNLLSTRELPLLSLLLQWWHLLQIIDLTLEPEAMRVQHLCAWASSGCFMDTWKNERHHFVRHACSK